MNLRYFLNTKREWGNRPQNGGGVLIKNKKYLSKIEEEFLQLIFYFCREKQHKGKLIKRSEQALPKIYPKVNKLMKKW